ncbi:hypothetical protein FB451DRAFT_1186229 [Mycena latifolia]|nr:hypothetical protein FB451DRAFT_1186229 [Mycena latifolia]
MFFSLEQNFLTAHSGSTIKTGINRDREKYISLHLLNSSILRDLDPGRISGVCQVGQTIQSASTSRGLTQRLFDADLMYIMGGRSSINQLAGISVIPVMEPDRNRAVRPWSASGITVTLRVVWSTARKVEGGKQPLKRDAESRGDSWSGVLDPVAEKEIHTLVTGLPPRRDAPARRLPAEIGQHFSHDAPPTIVYLRQLHTAQNTGLGVVIGLSGGSMAGGRKQWGKKL